MKQFTVIVWANVDLVYQVEADNRLDAREIAVNMLDAGKPPERVKGNSIINTEVIGGETSGN